MRFMRGYRITAIIVSTRRTRSRPPCLACAKSPPLRSRRAHIATMAMTCVLKPTLPTGSPAAAATCVHAPTPIAALESP